jgi:hypothetical protein
MKALSLWQPWASAIAVGAKRIETRHWQTSYRGPLLIHAAKTLSGAGIICCDTEEFWAGVFKDFPAAQQGLLSGNPHDLIRALPLGALIAVAELVAIRPTSQFRIGELEQTCDDGDFSRHPDRWAKATGFLFTAQERALGDYSPGRYGWVLANVRALPQPIPYKGAQGLFTVPETILPAEMRA